MLFPYKVDVPMQRWPVANFVIIGITVAVSALMMGELGAWRKGASSEGSVVDYFLLQPGNFRFSQLVGSTLIHMGYVHLVGNMMFLFVFGNAVNAKLGNVRYVILYVTIAVIEGLVWVAIGPGNPALGASGAIMGILGAYLILYPSNDVSVAYWWWINSSGVWDVAGGWLIAMYVAYDMWGMIFSKGAGVGYLAHVSGFFTGVAILGAMVHWRWVESDRHERNLWEVMGWREHPEERAMREEISARKASGLAGGLARGRAGLSSGDAPVWMKGTGVRREEEKKPPIQLD